MYKNCRHRLKHRARPVGGKRIVIPNRVSISERPKEVDGVRFGDFEMDTLFKLGLQAIARCVWMNMRCL